MGKVSRRLTIVVFPPLGEWPEIVKLEEQGHNVHTIDEEDKENLIAVKILLEADLIIGPQCWYFDVKHRKYLTQAIKQARLKRYGKPKKKEADDEKPDSDIPFDSDTN